MGSDNHAPRGHHTVTPYLIVRDAARAIEFYRAAFGAVEVMRYAEPSGRIVHAELKIGDTVFMLGDEFPEINDRSPRTLGGSPVQFHLYVADADSAVNQAAAAGGRLLRPVDDRPNGNRGGVLADPFGYTWHIITHKADMTAEEIRQRAEAAGGGWRAAAF